MYFMKKEALKPDQEYYDDFFSRFEFYNQDLMSDFQDK